MFTGHAEMSPTIQEGTLTFTQVLLNKFKRALNTLKELRNSQKEQNPDRPTDRPTDRE